MRKAKYDLRQAPSACYSTLSNFLVFFGFKNSITDKSLFIYNTIDLISYVLVYVVDIIITRNTVEILKVCVATLLSKFSLRDLGSLSYFLGIEILHDNRGVIMSQNKYVRDILDITNMADSKPSNEPMITTTSLSLFNGT